MKTITSLIAALTLSCFFSAAAYAQDNATELSAGVNKLVAEQGMNVYPNPNPGNEAHVQFEGLVANDLLVVVYDMLGREMYTKIQVVEKEGFLFSFDPALPKGIYLIIASADDIVFRQKLIVK
jgi:hypothetical protein